MDYFNELKKYNYLIAVPSRGRKDLLKNKKGVWRNFTRPYKDYPLLLVIREEEENDYKEFFDGQILTTKNNTDITETRQCILDYSIKNNYDFLIMIDDDVVIYYREESLSSKYGCRIEKIVEENMLHKLLYESLSTTNNNFPLTGIPSKQGSFSRKYTFEKNTMIIRYACYHLPTWKKENIHCNGLKKGVMEDYYVQLKLLSLGYRTLSNCRWSIDDRGTGFHGGCNSTRTVKVQNESAKELKRLFPDYVILKLKQDGKKYWKEDRLDVSLRLKKFLDKKELPYVPKEEILNKFIQEK